VAGGKNAQGKETDERGENLTAIRKKKKKKPTGNSKNKAGGGGTFCFERKVNSS